MSKRIICVFICLILTGCGDLFLRSLDEFNAGLGGQRTCQYEADYQTIYGDGYSYEFGGYCNQWLGTLRNNSEYTIKCSHTLDGRPVNSVYAGPRQTVDEKFIAQMNTGYLQATCKHWDRAAKLQNRYSETRYSVYSLLSSGVWKLKIENNASYTRTCRLLDNNKRVIVEQTLVSGQSSGWWTEPNGTFFTQCIS